MHRPPDLTLPATPVNAPAPEWMTPITTTSRPRGSGMFGNGTNRQLQQVETSVRTQGITRTVRQEFETKSQALPTNLDAEISSHRSQYPNSSLSAVQAWQREVDIREALRTRKTAELAQRTTIANAFFGSDPRDKSFADFVRKATTIDTLIWPGARSTQLWEQSFLAAHEAQLLRQSIALLQQQSATAHVYLRAAQNQEQAARVAAEQARVAAEQAQQLAAQRSRIAAEQKRQKDIADAVRREQEQALAREQTRLAALAEKQRLADEQERLAVEALHREQELKLSDEKTHRATEKSRTSRAKKETAAGAPESPGRRRSPSGTRSLESRFEKTDRGTLEKPGIRSRRFSGCIRINFLRNAWRDRYRSSHNIGSQWCTSSWRRLRGGSCFRFRCSCRSRFCCPASPL
ncbi:hypothetical protein RCC30_04200 [Pseudomonas fluorescens]|nr:hypothetical protein RCC30_04200 [Pseudomonas fluorescens]